MKPIKQIKMGSSVFFDGLPNFKPKDYDELCIMDSFFDGKNSMRAEIAGKDVFFYRNLDKEGFIKDCFNSQLPMKAGKFLVPEFAEYLGLTIDDLKVLEPVFDKIDEKHEYEKLIFNSYIQNNGFYLTDEQRDAAYKSYKERRIVNE